MSQTNTRKALGKGLEQLFNSEMDFNTFEKDIVENTNKSDIVTATYIIIILLAILSIFLSMYYCIAPMINKIINKRKFIAREYENDLSYILLKMER